MKPDIFDSIDVEISPQQYKNSGADIFDQIKEPEEGFWKSAARDISQIPLGVAEVTGPGLIANLISTIGTGESLDPEEIEHIKMISEREGIPFDEEKYMQAVQGAHEAFPTVSNLAKLGEKVTGAPLEAKTGLQKGIKFAASAGKLTPGTITQKATGAAVASGSKIGLEELGLPEPIAEALALGVGTKIGSLAPAIDIGKSTKTSGLPKRGFESLKEPRKVSENKLNLINEKLEKDFKTISDKIIKESPVGETFDILKENPAFKSETRELLEEAQSIADTMPSKMASKTLKKELADIGAKRKKGYADSEYDKSYSKFMNESIKDIPKDDMSAGKLVEQYRKNNKALGEYFEPGSSKALNRAKKDALLDQNRAIASSMEKEFPQSELVKTFKEGNERWSKIMDAEKVDSFVDDLFSEGINFKKMNQFLEKEGYEYTFKRALGDKGYQEFKGVISDMLTSEKPYNMLKLAKTKGWSDLYNSGLGYILNPKIGMGYGAYKGSKFVYKSLLNTLLDEPKLAFTWKKGVDNLKKGDFKLAAALFNELDSSIERLENESSDEKPE